MSLKAIHETLEDIPESYRDLYTERDGKYALTGIEGVKTQIDMDKVNAAATHEREQHKKTKERYRPFAEMDAEDVVAKLDKFDELEALANGKGDKEAIEELAEKKLKTKLAPIERKMKELETANGELTSAVGGYQAKDRQRLIHDSARAALNKAKVISSAHDDALMLAERMFEVDDTGKVVTKDGMGVTPGVDAEVWLTEMQPKRTHWWEQSMGSGAAGSGTGGGGFSENPWSHGHWNLTKQGHLYKESPERAGQMAKSAGTTVGGLRPPAK